MVLRRLYLFGPERLFGGRFRNADAAAGAFFLQVSSGGNFIRGLLRAVLQIIVLAIG
jgi:hypothetical protein